MAVERVAGLFGDSVPSDINERNAIINSFPDDGEAQAALDREQEDVDRYLLESLPALELRLEAYLEAWLESAGRSW